MCCQGWNQNAFGVRELVSSKKVINVLKMRTSGKGTNYKFLLEREKEREKERDTTEGYNLSATEGRMVMVR